MKTYSLLTFFILGSVTSAFAIDLNQATNSQLLQELERRLGMPPISENATAIYSCDSSTRLHIELYSKTGIQKKEFYVGDQSVCEETAQLLTQNKTKIISLTIAAFCDSSTRLHKIPLKTDGQFGTEVQTHIGDQDKCIAQAKQINSSN